MRAGLVVDGIKIQDEIFGLCPNGCNSRSYDFIDLNPGETVESIIYGRNSGSTSYRNLTCGLRFITNTRTIGPFSWTNICPPIYRVDIPPEKPLGIYFKENVKTRGSYFNGFTSEYNTEATK